MTPEELQLRGENAARLLRDTLLTESLDILEHNILMEWENCPARDVEGREELWKYYKTSKKFRNILAGIVESGRVANFLKNPDQTLVQRTVAKFRR